jgi:hypothetical protein
VSRFDAIHEIWLTAARCKAAWEAWAVVSTSGCTNPFTEEGAMLDCEYTSSSSRFGSGEGATLGDADASSTCGSGEGTTDNVINVSSGDEEDV